MPLSQGVHTVPPPSQGVHTVPPPSQGVHTVPPPSQAAAGVGLLTHTIKLLVCMHTFLYSVFFWHLLVVIHDMNHRCTHAYSNDMHINGDGSTVQGDRKWCCTVCRGVQGVGGEQFTGRTGPVMLMPL